MGNFVGFINLFTPPAEMERIREREARRATAQQLNDLISGSPEILPTFGQPDLRVDGLPVEGPQQPTIAGSPAIDGILPQGGNRDFISALLNSRSSAISGVGINQASTALQELQQRQLATKETDIAAKAREALLATRRANVAGLGELSPQLQFSANTFIDGNDANSKLGLAALNQQLQSFNLSRGQKRFDFRNKPVASGLPPADVVTRNASRKDQADKLSGIAATAQSMSGLVNRFLPEGNQKDFLNAMLSSQDVGTISKGITATQEAFQQARRGANLKNVFGNEKPLLEQLKQAQLIPGLSAAATAQRRQLEGAGGNVAFTNVKTDDAGVTTGIPTGKKRFVVIPRDDVFRKYRKISTTDENGNPEERLVLVTPSSPDIIKFKKPVKQLSQAAQDAFSGGFDALSALKLMQSGIKETGIAEGYLSKVQSFFGFNPKAIGFQTGRSNFILSSSALIKGVPSDFDVKNLIKTIGELTLSEPTNVARIAYSQKLIEALIKRNIAYNKGIGKRIPPEIMAEAKANGIDVSSIRPNTKKLFARDLPQPPTAAQIERMQNEADRLSNELDL